MSVDIPKDVIHSECNSEFTGVLKDILDCIDHDHRALEFKGIFHIVLGTKNPTVHLNVDASLYTSFEIKYGKETFFVKMRIEKSEWTTTKCYGMDSTVHGQFLAERVFNNRLILDTEIIEKLDSVSETLIANYLG